MRALAVAPLGEVQEPEGEEWLIVPSKPSAGQHLSLTELRPGTEAMVHEREGLVRGRRQHLSDREGV